MKNKLFQPKRFNRRDSVNFLVPSRLYTGKFIAGAGRITRCGMYDEHTFYGIKISRIFATLAHSTKRLWPTMWWLDSYGNPIETPQFTDYPQRGDFPRWVSKNIVGAEIGLSEWWVFLNGTERLEAQAALTERAAEAKLWEFLDLIIPEERQTLFMEKNVFKKSLGEVSAIIDREWPAYSKKIAQRLERLYEQKV